MGEKQNSMRYSAPKKTSAPEVPSLSKSKQNTPNRDSLILGKTSRATKSMPKDPSLIRPPEPEQPKPISNPYPSNNSNDMEYQEYMNLISKVRKTKEVSMVRAEHYKLASLYAKA